MEHAEYMKIKYKYFPLEIRAAYNLNQLVTPDGWVYIEIMKGIYGLKQVVRIAYELLKTRLAKYGYTPCIGKHQLLETHNQTHQIQFMCRKFWYQIIFKK